MADSLVVFVPHAQAHGASRILKQVGKLSSDGTKARAVRNVMELIANSPSAAPVWAICTCEAFNIIKQYTCVRKAMLCMSAVCK